MIPYGTGTVVVTRVIGRSEGAKTDREDGGRSSDDDFSNDGGPGDFGHGSGALGGSALLGGPTLSGGTLCRGGLGNEFISTSDGQGELGGQAVGVSDEARDAVVEEAELGFMGWGDQAVSGFEAELFPEIGFEGSEVGGATGKAGGRGAKGVGFGGQPLDRNGVGT